MANASANTLAPSPRCRRSTPLLVARQAEPGPKQRSFESLVMGTRADKTSRVGISDRTDGRIAHKRILFFIRHFSNYVSYSYHLSFQMRTGTRSGLRPAVMRQPEEGGINKGHKGLSRSQLRLRAEIVFLEPRQALSLRAVIASSLTTSAPPAGSHQIHHEFKAGRNSTAPQSRVDPQAKNHDGPRGTRTSRKGLWPNFGGSEARGQDTARGGYVR
jgi:hypothetical protein